MPAVYAFEIKSIQNYTLDGNKLKDMVGASEQIEYACFFDAEDKSLLDEVISALGLNNCQFIRKAGGSFTVILGDLAQAQQLQATWTFAIQRFLPGVSFTQGLQEYKDGELREALESVRGQLQTSRNLNFPRLPLAGPMVARSPRTGQPACGTRRDGKEQMDAAISRKDTFYRDRMRKEQQRVIRKLEGETPEFEKFAWPVNLDPEEKEDQEETETDFPFIGDNRYIGIVHADGNGLGQLLQDFEKKSFSSEDDYIKKFWEFSQAIDKATVQAASQAVQEILKPELDSEWRVPARPLVLGGDDLTFIVRANLAIPFTEKFLAHFEENSKNLLGPLGLKGLTACAGITFIKASQPFYLAYHLAETLCGFAKNQSGREISCLAFHRITTSVIEDYSTIVKRELTTDSFGELAMQPYAVAKNDKNLPRISELDALCDFLESESISKGAVRELMTLLHLDRVQAEQHFTRWLQNVGGSQNLAELKGKLKALTGKSEIQKLADIFNAEKRTPLGDALALIMVRKGGKK